MSTPTVHRSDPTVLRVMVFEKVKHMHENATRKVRILEIARQRWNSPGLFTLTSTPAKHMEDCR